MSKRAGDDPPMFFMKTMKVAYSDIANSTHQVQYTSESVEFSCADHAHQVPSYDVPAEDVSAEDVSAEDVPTRNVPTLDVPTLDVPTLDVPTLDVPTHDVPTHNVPTQDVPTQDVPTQDVSTLDLPANKFSAHNLPANLINWKPDAARREKEQLDKANMTQEKGEPVKREKAIKEEDDDDRKPDTAREEKEQLDKANMSQEKGEPVKREKDIKEEDDDDDLKDTIVVKLTEEDEMNSEVGDRVSWVEPSLFSYPSTPSLGPNHNFMDSSSSMSSLPSIGSLSPPASNPSPYPSSMFSSNGLGPSQYPFLREAIVREAVRTEVTVDIPFGVGPCPHFLGSANWGNLVSNTTNYTNGPLLEGSLAISSNIVNMVTLIYCPCNDNCGLVRIRTMPHRDITQFIGNASILNSIWVDHRGRQARREIDIMQGQLDEFIPPERNVANHDGQGGTQNPRN